MSKLNWEYKITIRNATNESLWVQCDVKQGKLADPQTMIAPNCETTYRGYSPFGMLSGIEFRLTLRSETNGAVMMQVQIPLVGSNWSSCDATGRLGIVGFQPIPPSGHNFSRGFTVYTKE